MQMYDLSSKFNTFYRKYVVLPRSKKDELFAKKNLNINRLKDGLKEYNEEKETDYKLVENIVQGSVAMATVVQKEDNDYDIDVAIVFDKDKLPEGTIGTKNMVVDALKRKCTGFKKEPEAKTNCVRIEYNDGYHIDFAIYRRFKYGNDEYQYEHCGSEWRQRDPKAITKWFYQQNKEKDYKLREVVRLLKMFSKSRDSWVNMPGGLILSVLANEQFKMYDRIDERFYYTIRAIRDRLTFNKEVYNPTDPTQSLKLVSKDDVKLTNLYNRLNDKLAKLDVLFDSSCSYNQAIEAWEDFFNHEYWTSQKQEIRVQISEALTSLEELEDFYDYDETEEFVDYLFPIDLQYQLDLDCKVSQNGKTIGQLNSMLKRREPLLPGYDLYFYAQTDVPLPFKVYWKVKNQGLVAKQQNCVRGELMETGKLSHYEVTSFKGNHYVECYIIKNGVVVAKKRINVPIKI